MLHGPEADKISLYGVGQLTGGFRQITQRDLLAEFSSQFFKNIRHITNSRAKSVSQQYYFNLRPSFEASPKEIQMFEDFSKELNDTPKEQLGDGDARLKEWVKETISELKEKKQARELSR